MTGSADAICPYCGQTHDSSDLAEREALSEDEKIIACDECGKDFRVIGWVSWRFTTQPIEEVDIEVERKAKALYDGEPIEVNGGLDGPWWDELLEGERERYRNRVRAAETPVGALPSGEDD